MFAAWALLPFLAEPAAAAAVPSFAEVQRDFRPSDTLILDRHGVVVQRLRTDPAVRRGQWVALTEVSPALRAALVLSEDRRFYQHSGVDWQAVSAAVWGHLFHGRTRGASTLTMQLAGLLDANLRVRGGGRDWGQKLGQTLTATALERQWRKDEILEAYLNLVPFRGDIVGIDALSRTLFGKAPQGLDAREAAITAALVRAPNASAAKVAQRACGVLQDMQPRERLSDARHDPCAGLVPETAAALQRRAFPASEGIAPHLGRRLVALAVQPGSRAPAQIQSTLDARIQRVAQAALLQALGELSGRNVQDGAVLVLDNASGEVLAWVGSSGDFSTATEVDGVTARRQPGSTLKPLLYAQALAEHRLTAASLLDDTPTQIPTASGLYMPQNYDHRFKGWVSVRTALASSLNIPAVRTLVMVTPEAFARELKALGVSLAQPGDYYGYSLALGAAEVSLRDLTNAYRALANGGRVSPVVLLPGRQSRPRSVLDPGAAWIIGDILSDPNARAPTFGTDSLLATRFWTAVKTGTSKDMRDNWAVGWSRRYTVGVWVGNAAGAPMHDVSGVSGAAPIWAEVMRALHAASPSRQSLPPPGLLRAQVHFDPNGEAPRREWFLPGTAQPRFVLGPRAHTPSLSADLRPDGGPEAGASGRQRIMAPVDGTILALDPDIPPRHQRVELVAVVADARWQLDGRDLGRGARLPWFPQPGRHRIALVDAHGQVLDSIALEVRGAGLQTPR
nr:penicillin-binding protein 1C [Thiomonas intermedia]